MNTTYKRQTDLFCDEHITISAEDILRKARTAQPMALQPAQPKRRLRPMLLVAAAAACFLIVGATAVAVSGGWGAFINTLFGDKTTADIADEGYISEFSMRGSDGPFTVDFIAGTGDRNAPKLLFDVHIDDDSLLSDRIYMMAYVLSKEVYENDLENYWYCDAYGYRDEQFPSIYHVMLDAPYGYFLNPTDIVIDVCGIVTAPDTDKAVQHETSIRFDIFSEDIKLLPVMDHYPTMTHYEYGGIKYELLHFTTGEYETELNFRFKFLGSELADGETDFYKLEGRLMDNWQEFTDEIVLTVDGVEYTVDKDRNCFIWYDEQAEAGTADYCYITAYMPPAGMRYAQDAVLTICGINSTLK